MTEMRSERLCVCAIGKTGEWVRKWPPCVKATRDNALSLNARTTYYTSSSSSITSRAKRAAAAAAALAPMPICIVSFYRGSRPLTLAPSPSPAKPSLSGFLIISGLKGVNCTVFAGLLPACNVLHQHYQTVCSWQCNGKEHLRTLRPFRR